MTPLRAKIEIKGNFVGGKAEIDAYVLKYVAVHRMVDSKSRWVITHLGTGLNMSALGVWRTKRDAMRAAQLLDAHELISDLTAENSPKRGPDLRDALNELYAQ